MKTRYYGSYPAYAACFFWLYFANGIVYNILSVYLLGQGQTALATSTIVIAGSIFSVLLQPTLGALTDKLGRPAAIITVTLTVATACCAGFAVSRTVVFLFLFNGLMLSLTDSVSLLFEQLAAKNPFSYGSIRIWGTIGYAVAAQVASIVYESIAPVAVFWCYGIGMLLTLLALRAVPLSPLVTKKESAKADRPTKNKDGVFKLLKNPSFLLFLALCLLFRGVLTVGTTYLQPLLMSHGLSVSASGTVVFIATMTEVPLLLFSGKMMDRIRSRPALMACFAALAGVLLCLGLSPALPPIIVASILRPLVGMVFNMLALKITMLLAPGDLMSTAIGLTGAAKCLGVISFQSMGGSLMDAMGISSLFTFLAILSCVGLGLSLFCKVQDNPNQTLFAKK